MESNLRGSSAEIINRDDIRNFKADIGVLVAYGQIVPQEIIDVFPRGIVNIHPSLLPKHRGSIPIEGVILNGEHITGVSLMALSAKMDAGPIYAQEKVVLIGNETKAQLARKFSKIGQDLLLDNLPAILDGTLEPRPQNDTEATYDKQITKQDGIIDWHKPALQLEREVRAYEGWPRSRTKLGGKDIVITKAHIAEGSGTPGEIWRQNKTLGIFTSEGVLVVDSLIPSGKKEMTAESFLAGYQI
jgi:methionyl-tRNA formyltransferase